MFQVHLLKVLRRWGYHVLAAQPSNKEWVLMEGIGSKEFVQNDTARWQTMVTIVLVVHISEFVSAYTFAAQTIIFTLEPAASPLLSE